MVIDEKLHALVKRIATKELGEQFVSDVRIVPSTDSEGRDALRLTIVLNDGAAQDIEGDNLIELLVELRRGLSNAGEGRIPVVDYAEVADMAEDGDPQS